ncbi:MAG: Lrp/AsnC ligand binding domain-containing protein [Thaumarchaeota archaeon]|nr:Lrp/AsnC ligand binding domain-containing protein [Nitrososphaerota archaeon]
MLKAEVQSKAETAFVMINCEAGQEANVIEQIRAISGVKEAFRTNGQHDILSSVEASSVESLREIIDQRIRKTPHVRSTTTLIKSY